MKINNDIKIQNSELNNAAKVQEQKQQEVVSVNFDESSDNTHEEINNNVNVNDINNLDDVVNDKSTDKKEDDTETAKVSDTPDESVQPEETKKKTFSDICNDMYHWFDDNFGQPFQKMGDDINKALKALDLDKNVKNKRDGSKLILWQEQKQHKDFTYSNVDVIGNKVSDMDGSTLYDAAINFNFNKQLLPKLNYSNVLNVSNKVNTEEDFLNHLNLNRGMNNFKDNMINVPAEFKIETNIKDKNTLTYDITKHLQNKTTLDVNESFSATGGLQNNITLSDDLKYSYEPNKLTKGSTTISASEQYTNTDLKFSSGISSNMNYSDLLLYNGAQKLQLDLSSNANVFYNNDLKLENQLLDQNVGMKTEATGKLSYMEILYMHKNGSRITWDSSLTQKASYGNNYNLLKDEFTWNTDLYTGISTSLTFKVADQLEITPFVSGSYTLSTKDDTYDVGAGFKGKWTPVPDQKDFNINFGANYSRKDDTNPNTDKLTQELALNAGINFDKNFGLNASYNVNLDGKKANEFNFGVKVNF